MGRVDKAKTFVGDTPAKASEVNTVFDDIYNEFNGSVDEYNLNLDRPELKAALGDLFYPVGSKYTNFSDSTNPSTLLGFGTWERIAEGRVIVGVDSADTDFDTAEKTGGEKTHTLTDAEMPSHNHIGSGTTGDDTHSHTSISQITFGNGNTRYSGGGADNIGNTGTPFTTSSDTHNHSYSFTTNTKGSDEAHNNLQPYITAYIWKRVA
jgi:hypothetical protein